MSVERTRHATDSRMVICVIDHFELRICRKIACFDGPVAPGAENASDLSSFSGEPRVFLVTRQVVVVDCKADIFAVYCVIAFVPQRPHFP